MADYTRSLQISSQISKEFIVPKVGYADPVHVVSSRSVRKTEFILFGIEYYVDTLVARHGPG
jgi:hypothetical protein